MVKTKKSAELKGPLDLNKATSADFQLLPGVGPKTAEHIVDERRKRPFGSVDELRRVAGIGPKTLEKLRPYLIVTKDGNERASAEHP